MPTITKPPIKSADRYASRIPPTPWITAVHPVSEDKYVYRIRLHRRGGAINVQFHKQSPVAPGKTLVIARSRPSYHDFVVAADALLRTSMYDPGVNPASAAARSVWRKTSVEYSMRMTNAQTVTLRLDRLLNPKPGRPLSLDVREIEIAVQRAGGTNVSHVTARANRRAELLTACVTATNAFGAVRDKLHDARGMKGYTKEEVMTIREQVNNVSNTLEILRRTMQAYDFRDTPDRQQATPQTTITIDELPTQGGVALSEAEQRIAQRQTEPINLDD